MTRQKKNQNNDIRDTKLDIKTVDGMKTISGRIWYADAPFEFSLREQKNGKMGFRGSVRAVSLSGKTLKRRGKEMRDILSSECSEITKGQRLRVTRTVSCSNGEENEIMKRVEKAVKELYRDNAVIISGNINGDVTPESITPSVAADAYGNQFINKKFRDSSDDRRDLMLKKLKNVSLKFPAKPMASFNKSRVKALIKDENIGKPTVELLHDFWEYCVEDSICEGDNPVVEVKKKKRSNRSKQLAAMRIDELNYDQFTDLCEKLARDGNGISAGIALMASGFKPADIERFTWNDLVLRKDHDHVIVKLNLNERGGATQNYSRPMLPITAKIIWDRYDSLRKKYGNTVIMEWPVASLASSPEVPLNKAALVQEATRALKTIAISNNVFAALRDEDRSLAAATTLLGHTYERILRTRCNLDDDEGTVKFLLGKSFGTDTTSNNYTSFTSDYGERRLYELLKCVRKEEGHRDLLKTDKNNPGLFVCQPATNLQYARVTAEVTLSPGESMKMTCRHGVTGMYETKAVR